MAKVSKWAEMKATRSAVLRVLQSVVQSAVLMVRKMVVLTVVQMELWSDVASVSVMVLKSAERTEMQTAVLKAAPLGFE